MFIREKYLQKIRPYYDSEQIKVITGLRRCGKSTLLNQIIIEITEKVPKDRIFYMDFEDFDSEIFHNDPHSLYEILKKFVEGKERCYVFLDEIQHVARFELLIASIRSKLKCSLFVTGSNSTLLAGELASRLTGRTVEIQVMPFSYSEVVEYTGQDSDDTFFDYMKNGGIPIRFNENAIPMLNTSLTLYKGILSRDIFSKNDIKNRQQFNNFSSYILANSGETISTTSIEGYMKKEKESIASSTLYRYLEYLESAYLVSKCSRYDIKGKQMLSTRMKYYAMDTSFISIQKGNRDINQGLVLETLVFNELISRGYQVYIGKTYKGEIDFIVSDGIGKCYIQVCFLLATEEVIAREFSAFGSIKDNYPKYVLSLDKIDMSQNGIVHINIRDFLTGRKEIHIG